MPSYRFATRTRAVAIPILRDPAATADLISAEVHRRPTCVRRAEQRSAAEERDLALSTARAALLAIGLPETWVATIMDEAEQMTEAM